jgi:hypothetical protein
MYRRPDGLWIVEGNFPRSEGGKYWCRPASKVEAYLWRKLHPRPARRGEMRVSVKCEGGECPGTAVTYRRFGWPLWCKACWPVVERLRADRPVSSREAGGEGERG